MTGWINLTDDQRRRSLLQAEIKSSYAKKAIEKDWWVTLILKALFQSTYAPYFTFKGGTSLSKGYQLINRFSEDIDIALAPEAFGQAYVSSPTRSYVKKLKKQGCIFTSTILRDDLERTLLAMQVKPKQFALVTEKVPAERPDKDPQTLYLQYRSLLPVNAYLRDEVKIEFSIRSLSEPHVKRPIQSLLWEHLPHKAYEETLALIRTAHPKKTFLEKAFLLHEKFANHLKPAAENLKLERGSRHLYDICKMDDQGITDLVLADPSFYKTLLEHRRHWIRLKGIDYDTLHPSLVNFVPPPITHRRYAQDYKAMETGGMLTQKYHNFEVLISRLQHINNRFRYLQIPGTKL
ncbi:nucleotidyl transferase AbiEii/AbiGii toxin family protein [Chitinophaga eiseniae]|uniref:Nucleotidyl transferase AbiEii/AbiGii toxin family protein n=1 Tax=Chitinophaga eiseniae TaxID=634771 RepID=A0A847SWL2_9BACT|nr:nucleotidyl transferase AbiEii/AbiGii toxin family protein [Chitinophaga eiseniae]NLR81492.1 nucleotidyl transferase AbiEii/AbiGii toxin family protein [Chitinophaga eiseniae]